MKTKAWQIQILGLLALLLLFIVTLPTFVSRIPTTLKTHLSQNLIQQGYDWVNVEVKGRTVTLSGNAPTHEASFAALNVVKKYTPLLRINDHITPRIIQPYTMKMQWDGKQLLLAGYVPDRSSYQHFIEVVYQSLDKNNIEDKLKVGAGAPEHWNQLLDTSLQGLLELEQGNLEITNQSLYFAGQMLQSEKRDELVQRLAQYDHYQQTLHLVAADENNKICNRKFKTLLRSRKIEFTSDEAIISKSSYPLLKKLANTAALCSQFQINIEGHTDSIGNEVSNMKLSLQRAKAVTSWLFQQGIAEQQLNAVGNGSKQPIADNNSEEGRAKNRRIEFIVKGKGE